MVIPGIYHSLWDLSYLWRPPIYLSITFLLGEKGREIPHLLISSPKNPSTLPRPLLDYFNQGSHYSFTAPESQSLKRCISYYVFIEVHLFNYFSFHKQLVFLNFYLVQKIWSIFNLQMLKYVIFLWVTESDKL
jgi:hypothetical protein